MGFWAFPADTTESFPQMLALIVLGFLPTTQPLFFLLSSLRMSPQLVWFIHQTHRWLVPSWHHMPCPSLPSKSRKLRNVQSFRSRAFLLLWLVFSQENFWWVTFPPWPYNLIGRKYLKSRQVFSKADGCNLKRQGNILINFFKNGFNEIHKA